MASVRHPLIPNKNVGAKIYEPHRKWTKFIIIISTVSNISGAESKLRVWALGFSLLPGETSEHLVKGAWGSPPLALCIRVMVACISFSHLISLISLSTTLTLNRELGIRRDVEITIPKPEGNQGSSLHLHLRLLLPPGSFYPVPLPSNQYQVLSLPRNLYSLLSRCVLFRCIVYEESTETRHPLMRINPRAS
ncbi:hypothetical protein KQX54_017619 [Cotesia glomerata]|uniref:Uncharacterized protein n=1 Tax=Cotesia glomerata TaxID=32391 RepID=A0AAV7IGJ4_COTGL|nr:hypothetical protein KQX54_017619 [Cotesia glomerata]